MLRSVRPWLVAVVLLGIAVRAGMIYWKSSELLEDRDAYLGIAASVADGRGYSSPGSTNPTAYRPPLYPLLLAAGPQSHRAAWVAFLNLLSGAGTVVLTYLLAKQLGLEAAGRVCAAGLVAIDPLLVRYVSQPMTESVCTLLVTAWLWQTLRLLERPTPARGVAAGLSFGLAALCRPTVWMAGGLVGVWIAWRWIRGTLGDVVCSREAAGELDGERSPDGSRLKGPAKWGAATVIGGVIGCLTVVTPWAVRNYFAFGSPILTTTHGGYTLLLGNNVVFFHEYARHPFEAATTLATSTAHAEWMLREQQGMLAAGVHDEVDADRWMSRRAWEHIGQDRLGFLAACALREYWFWNIVPLRESRTGWQGLLVQWVGAYYALLWLACLAGLFSTISQRAAAWVPGLLTIVAFASVHLLYWSNARMRAPLMPILALLAVRGVIAIRRLIRPSAPLSGRG